MILTALIIFVTSNIFLSTIKAFFHKLAINSIKIGFRRNKSLIYNMSTQPTSVPLEEVYKLLAADALPGDSKYYLDVFAARGDNPILALQRRLYGDPAGKQQILFSGYRGCGKSTELNRLKKEIESDFIVVSYSVIKELDTVNLNYVELVTLTMEKLFKAVDDAKLPVSENLLNSIYAWLKTEEIETVRKASGAVEVEAGAEGKINVLSLVKFFAKIRASSNLSYNIKKTVTEVVERRLSDFIEHCNDLIREVLLKLKGTGKKGLLIVIEDLDKLSVDSSEDLFFKHSNVLTSLNANVIFTYPISLCHHTNANIIEGNFTKKFLLPMVKINGQNGAPYQAGRNALKHIVTKRIGAGSFESDDVLNKFVEMSGGCIRDLFKLIVDAADSALNHKRKVITEADFKYGFLALKRDYSNTIAEKRINNTVITTVDAYYDALVAAATSTTKEVRNDGPTLDLLQNLCILGYNGEGRCDVHPIVREILKGRNLI